MSTFLRITTVNPEATEAACRALAEIGLSGFGAHSCGPTATAPDPVLAAKTLREVPGVTGCWANHRNLISRIGARA